MAVDFAAGVLNRITLSNNKMAGIVEAVKTKEVGVEELHKGGLFVSHPADHLFLPVTPDFLMLVVGLHEIMAVLMIVIGEILPPMPFVWKSNILIRLTFTLHISLADISRACVDLHALLNRLEFCPLIPMTSGS